MLMALETYIKKYDVDVRGVLHIGAHCGQEVTMYRSMGVTDVILFEPVTYNYERLLDNIGPYQAINIALGNKTGGVKMNIERANDGMSCSILELGTHQTLYPRIKYVDSEIVWMKRLDDVTFDRSVFNVIVIDVQGYELEVFKGAVKTLETIDAVYTEINTEHVYKGCALVDEIDAYLSQWGFIRRETKMAHHAWGDALYVKT